MFSSARFDVSELLAENRLSPGQVWLLRIMLWLSGFSFAFGLVLQVLHQDFGTTCKPNCSSKQNSPPEVSGACMVGGRALGIIGAGRCVWRGLLITCCKRASTTSALVRLVRF